MTERLYPFVPSVFDNVSEITVGMKIPALPDTKSACKNCGDFDGFLWYYEVVPSGRLFHYFEDEYGNIRKMNASLRSVPCAACKPNTPIPDLETSDKEVDWWD